MIYMHYILYAFGALFIFNGYVNWRQSIRFTGPKAYRTSLKMIRLRARQAVGLGTFWWVTIFLTGAVMYFFYSGLYKRDIHLAVIMGMLVVGFFLVYTAAPVVVFFGTSTSEGKKLFGKVAWNVPGEPLSLIRPSKFTLYSLAFIRTRQDQWQRTVLELSELSSLIVVDARVMSDLVAKEADWMLDPDTAFKTVFVVGNDGARPILDSVDPAGNRAAACNALVVKESEAIKTLRSLTESPEHLPKKATYSENSTTGIAAQNSK
jgi:hypothetical protein